MASRVVGAFMDPVVDAEGNPLLGQDDAPVALGPDDDCCCPGVCGVGILFADCELAASGGVVTESPCGGPGAAGNLVVCALAMVSDGGTLRRVTTGDVLRFGGRCWRVLPGNVSSRQVRGDVIQFHRYPSELGGVNGDPPPGIEIVENNLSPFVTEEATGEPIRVVGGCGSPECPPVALLVPGVPCDPQWFRRIVPGSLSVAAPYMCPLDIPVGGPAGSANGTCVVVYVASLFTCFTFDPARATGAAAWIALQGTFGGGGIPFREVTRVRLDVPAAPDGSPGEPGDFPLSRAGIRRGTGCCSCVPLCGVTMWVQQVPGLFNQDGSVRASAQQLVVADSTFAVGINGPPAGSTQVTTCCCAGVDCPGYRIGRVWRTSYRNTQESFSDAVTESFNREDLFNVGDCAVTYQGRREQSRVLFPPLNPADSYSFSVATTLGQALPSLDGGSCAPTPAAALVPSAAELCQPNVVRFVLRVNCAGVQWRLETRETDPSGVGEYVVTTTCSYQLNSGNRGTGRCGGGCTGNGEGYPRDRNDMPVNAGDDLGGGDP